MCACCSSVHCPFLHFLPLPISQHHILVRHCNGISQPPFSNMKTVTCWYIFSSSIVVFLCIKCVCSLAFVLFYAWLEYFSYGSDGKYVSNQNNKLQSYTWLHHRLLVNRVGYWLWFYDTMNLFDIIMRCVICNHSIQCKEKGSKTSLFCVWTLGMNMNTIV